MPVTYKPKTDEEYGVVREIVEHVLHKHHGEMEDAGVTVQCLLACPPVDDEGEPTGPALSNHGVKCLAKIRTTKLKERVLGAADLEIEIDFDNWEVESNASRVAIIDHELTHRQLKTDRTGAVRRDDMDRPLFVRREHDMEVGWFHVVAQRHGEDSIEVRQCQRFLASDSYSQCYLPGMEDAGEEDESFATVGGK